MNEYHRPGVTGGGVGEDAAPGASPGREPALIQLESATVVRGGAPILDSVTLSIAAGEHTAILGPNGSGKSTLIKLLTCQLYPLSRREGPPPVRIFGRGRWNITELRSRMGIISADMQQRFVGGSSMGRVTGLDAVVAGFFASEIVFLHHEVTPALVRSAAAALERVGGASLARKRTNEMSTGEVRRVLIARALIHDPRLLILDEPTTGLDLVARREFLDHIRRLARSGTTLVLVTHHVEEIVPEIRKVVLLARGRVAAEGPPDAVLTPGELGAVFGSAVTVRRVGERYEMALDE
jgi:iron complex transport system ATP-binding protein